MEIECAAEHTVDISEYDSHYSQCSIFHSQLARMYNRQLELDQCVGRQNLICNLKKQTNFI